MVSCNNFELLRQDNALGPTCVQILPKVKTEGHHYRIVKD